MQSTAKRRHLNRRSQKEVGAGAEIGDAMATIATSLFFEPKLYLKQRLMAKNLLEGEPVDGESLFDQYAWKGYTHRDSKIGFVRRHTPKMMHFWGPLGKASASQQIFRLLLAPCLWQWSLALPQRRNVIGDPFTSKKFARPPWPIPNF